MAWTNIANGDNAGDILNKINGIGAYLANATEILENYQIPLSAWVSDSTYADFPYKADIPFSACTSNHIPYVHFGVDQEISGSYIGATSGEGKVSIWSDKRESFIIPYVLLFERSDR